MQECNGCGAVKETNLWKKSFEGALRERARELIEQILGGRKWKPRWERDEASGWQSA